MSTFLLGLSGGADSCYAALVAFRQKLDVILVNIDGNWATKEAENNIFVIQQYTKYPYYVYKMPESLNALRKAFLLSDTLYTESPADICYQAMLYDAAKEHKADFIASGMNTTEGNMPLDFSVVDSRFIKSVWKRFGEGKFPKDFPMLSMWQYYKYKKMVYRILDTIDYNPAQALKELKKIGFQWYGAKHLEDEFTKFNQGLRFLKFGVDVRIVNYKAMVQSGRMTLQEMYLKLANLSYSIPDFNELCQKVEGRIGIKIDNNFMTRPMRSWTEFKTWRPMLKFLSKVGIKRFFKMPY